MISGLAGIDLQLLLQAELKQSRIPCSIYIVYINLHRVLLLMWPALLHAGCRLGWLMRALDACRRLLASGHFRLLLTSLTDFFLCALLQACSRLTYEPLVFTKRPHTLNGYVVFGLAADNGECPESGSKVQFAARAGVSYLIYILITYAIWNMIFDSPRNMHEPSYAPTSCR